MTEENKMPCHDYRHEYRCDKLIGIMVVAASQALGRSSDSSGAWTFVAAKVVNDKIGNHDREVVGEILFSFAGKYEPGGKVKCRTFLVTVNFFRADDDDGPWERPTAFAEEFTAPVSSLYPLRDSQ